jgi:hypothetical protein
MNEKPRIYLAHPMRGKKGDTKESNKDYDYQNENCEIAIQNLKALREFFPMVNWYCPAEVEIPVQMAHRLGYLTVEQILDIDFNIIKNICSGALLHRWEDSVGVDQETARCVEWGYPHFIYEDSSDITECDLVLIKKLVDSVLDFHNLRN